MHSRYKAPLSIRPTDDPVVEEPTQDNYWHLHQQRERERQRRRVAREKARKSFLEKAGVTIQYQSQKKFIEDTSATRISPLRLQPGHLTAAVRRSPLFRLPANVREKIFAYTLTSPDSVPIKKHTTILSRHSGVRMQKVSWRWFPPLLGVSRQVEAEAASIFYRVTHFEVKICSVDDMEIGNWINDTQEGLLREVKHLTIVVEPIGFTDLQNIVEAKMDIGGQRAKAEMIARTITKGLLNAKVTLQGPCKEAVQALRVDAMKVWIGKSVTDGILREWMDELERAIGAE